MLRLENVSKDWREFKLKNISFEVKKGEYFILLGHSGAGKTLLLELIAGIQKPDKGRIYLEGEDITEKPPEKRNIAYVPQNYALFPHLSVYDNISYGLKLRKFKKEEIREIVKELSEVLGISHLLHRNPKTLSGGEQQRVALARALAIKPKLLLLDEPFSNLDMATRFRIIEEMKKWHKELGYTAIHVTHSFDEAMALGNRVGIMVNGRVEQVGKCEEVFSEPRSVEVAEFLGYNVLRGSIKDGTLHLNGLRLKADSKFEGEVTVVIKPEDVLLSKDGGFEAVVESIEFLKFLAVVTLNINGLKIKAQTTTENILKNRTKIGSKVRVSIKNLRLMV
ncbi:ATP-binding cassette domain-containing protein [Archaeoglobus sp.]